MKKHLKALSILTAAILGVSIFIPLAAVANNTSLPPATGNLIIQKYAMDDPTGAGIPNDGNPATNIPSDAVPLEGITFDIYWIEIDDPSVLPANDGNFTIDTLFTTLTSGGTDFALTYVNEVTTAADGTAVINDLPQGYYLVVEQTSGLVAVTMDPFIVAVPMTNATGDGWITDVYMYPKNEGISISKDVDKSAVFVGETVTWSIAASIPNEIASFDSFSITDILDPALTFVPGSVIVTGLPNKVVTSGTVIPQSTNYTVDEPSTTNSNTLTVDFTNPDGLDALAAYKYALITFETTVNDKILSNPNYTVENNATLDFINNTGNPVSKNSNIVKIHTGAIEIIKVDSETGNGLNVNGAEFQIASSEANAQNGNYLRIAVDGSIIDFGEPGYATAGEWIAITSGGTLSTPATAIFEGLKDYTQDASGVRTYLSYWLVETKAPNGYNLLANPIQVDFTVLNSTEAIGYTVTVTVNNTSTFTLPRTGNLGTILLAAGGGALIAVSAALIFNSRKKKRAIVSS